MAPLKCVSPKSDRYIFMQSPYYFKIATLSAVMTYFIYSAITYTKWHFLDGVDLLIHEAGHIVFMPFGEFISIAGGSILQILMTSAFVIYFLKKDELYSSSFAMFWVGQNLINISVYMKDAIEMKLPLIGGEIHDWNFIFTHLNLLSSSKLLGSLTYFLGFIIIVLAGIVGFYAVKDSGRTVNTHPTS